MFHVKQVTGVPPALRYLQYKILKIAGGDARDSAGLPQRLRAQASQLLPCLERQGIQCSIVERVWDSERFHFTQLRGGNSLAGQIPAVLKVLPVDVRVRKDE
jgi:hypothetical protein